ncbi:malonyl-ACP O-methyltransferase BioC [Magnetococcus sp. PR-3]|uniref:malonyl-ACP O-methyltransferase BioC n=1 Tax=Magnetococcus sp. PR-3 TaxID=3120355 RepID=UPI002FCE2A07
MNLPRGEGNRNGRVGKNFGRALNYHRKALVQQHVADELADRLGDFPLPDNPRILEIGCGTGFLSRHLARQWPEAEFIFTDIAPQMVQRCQSHLSDLPGKRRFMVMDGEHCSISGPFDLVVSSLAMQWFQDLPGSLQSLTSLLKTNGLLAFATLGDETFREWQGVCAQYGAPFGRPDYPDADQLQAMWPTGGEGDVEEDHIPVAHASGHGFLRALREVGAHQPSGHHRPVSAALMRRMLQATQGGQHGFTVTYHVLYGFYTRSLDDRPIH